MIVEHLLLALAGIGSAAAQSSACKFTSITIQSQGDVSKIANCGTVSGTVVLAPEAGPNIDLSGPKQITGDLTILNNGAIDILRSTSLAKVGGAFTMNNVTKLNTLQFPSLTSVKKLAWQSVTNLNTLRLGPLTEAEEVVISDTFLNSLDGIDLANVNKLDINNNRRLTKFATQLKTLSDILNIQANGISLDIDMPNLIWIANMTIANVTKFAVPQLKVVNGSARFDSNNFQSFSAPNLTHTESGDISFVGNSAMKNMTFPLLTSLGGGLLVANNTALSKIDGFPKLQTVAGAIKLRGNFTEVAFPKLNDVKGAFDTSSTTDIGDSCDKLKELSSSGKIQGSFSCTSNNKMANSDTGTNTSSSGSSDSGSSGSSDSGSGAAGVGLNTALFALVAVAALGSAL